MSLRDVSQSLSLSLEMPQLRVAELYDVALRDGNTYYYTSHHADIVWHDHTYLALPITRDPIQVGINLEIDTVKVYLAGISGNLVTYVQRNNLDCAEVTIRRILRGYHYAAENEWILFQGMADVEFSRDILVLELKPWIDSLNIQVPRCTYEEGCNWTFGDEFCGLDREDYAHTGMATGGTEMMLSDASWEAPVTPSVPRFGTGEVWMRSGDNAGQRRPVASHIGHSLEFLWPLPNVVAAGDSYTAYPGCDGRAVKTCLSWYANEDNFRAYVYIPRIEEAMLG